jgi:hypothetical protein
MMPRANYAVVSVSEKVPAIFFDLVDQTQRDGTSSALLASSASRLTTFRSVPNRRYMTCDN